MNKEQATQLLIRCVEIAQEKGAYSLNDARLILQAIDVLKQKPVVTEKTPVTKSNDIDAVVGEKKIKPDAEA